VSSPESPALFCDKQVRGLLLRPYDRVRVYRVVDDKEQDTVVAALLRAKQQLKTKSIVLEFYEKENWKTWLYPATGRSGGSRGAETPIRRDVIK